MASLKISDLCPSSFDSFKDSESFLEELNDNELAIINGGAIPLVLIGAGAAKPFVTGFSFGLGLGLGFSIGVGGGSGNPRPFSVAQK